MPHHDLLDLIDLIMEHEHRPCIQVDHLSFTAELFELEIEAYDANLTD